MKRILPLLAITAILFSCQEKKADYNQQLNEVADVYVETILEIGLYDPMYVDAYYGEDSIREAVNEQKQDEIPAEGIIARIDSLQILVAAMEIPAGDEMLFNRKEYMVKQLIAAKAKVEMLSGKEFLFDEESAALYDAVVPEFDETHFEEIIAELEKVLPGEEELIVRLGEFTKDFVIPKEKVDTVFKAAIAEARKRTAQHVDLPENENFVIEYVTDKPWSGYNWYKGNNFSLIQVNIDFPIKIDRAIDLACHEGYPGHHVYNALLESSMVKERGWKEFTVYPLYSPQSLIAEGTANFGIEVVFPKADRMKFEKEVLFQLAGLDTTKVDLYYEIQELTHDLSYARTMAMRNYLDGKWTKEEAGEWLEKYALVKVGPSTFRFPETYRSYIINYNWGQDMVKEYVEAQGGTEDNPEKRWEIFVHLISTPQTPSMLK